MNPRQTILTPAQVEQKIRRMAFEVYESHFEEQTLVLAGISGQGFAFAGRLAAQLESISPLRVHLVEIPVDKANPAASRPLPAEWMTFRGLCWVVCDDVLYTGRTLAYGLASFLPLAPKRLRVAVIVDRSYHYYPIRADFVGYSLMTTLNDHVQVLLDGPEAGVFL